jgi:class 3 adenylate cyclase
MTSLPSVTVTFLFTDIEGSTNFQEFLNEIPPLIANQTEIF